MPLDVLWIPDEYTAAEATLHALVPVERKPPVVTPL
jgi:hypothetical protein